MRKFGQIFAIGVGAIVVAACSSGAPSSVGAADPATPARTSVDGTFARFTVSPRGDVDGVVLQDGMVARFAPHTFVGGSSPLKAGDQLHVEGELRTDPTGRALDRATIRKGDAVIASDTLAAPPVAPRAELGEPPVTHAGVIARVLINPHGDADGLLLDDGAVVRFPPTPSTNLATGTRVEVTGRGTASFIEAETVKLGTGQTLPLGPNAAPPPPAPPPGSPPPPLPSLTESSTIAKILPNGEGQPDVLLLSSGALVRIPPPLRDAAADALKVGVAVRVDGEGGVYGGQKSIHARKLVIGGREFVEPEPAPGFAPPLPPRVAP